MMFVVLVPLEREHVFMQLLRRAPSNHTAAVAVVRIEIATIRFPLWHW